VAMINADGSGFRELTSGPDNNAFPSMSPDGRRFVYRSFGADGGGLRIMDIETKKVTSIASGYDNFPLWSPRGDMIMFSRQAEGGRVPRVAALCGVPVMILVRAVLVAIGLLVALNEVGTTVEGQVPTPVALPQERHLRNIKQLTFDGENAEAYFSFDGSRLTF